MSEAEDPTCVECEGPCAGDVTGALWCAVCGLRQEIVPEPEKTDFERALEAARTRLGMIHPPGGS